MTTSKTNMVYELDWDLLDGDVIGRLIRFRGSDDIVRWIPEDDPELPARILFQTHFALLQEAPDFPNNDVCWPIMSRRMIDVLMSVGTFRHRTIPVFLMDDTVFGDDRLDGAGAPKPGVAKDGYNAIQLLDYSDVLDRERSEFDLADDDPQEIGTIWKPIFRVPVHGLPPIFRIPEKPARLFLSAAARKALEDKGIKGPVYRPLSKCVL